MMTVTQRSVWYSFEFDCVLSGHDQVLMLGIPAGQAPAPLFSNADLKSLSGEAYMAPSMAVASMVFWSNPWAPWWSTTPRVQF